MNRIRVAAALLSALTLTGCATPATTLPATPPPAVPPAAAEDETGDVMEQEIAPAEEATATASPISSETNDRGNMVKKIGQRAGIIGENGTQTVDFTVTKITLKFKCKGGDYIQRPKNGSFIAIEVDVQTTKDAESFTADPVMWKVIGPDGTTENSSTGNEYGCVPTSRLLPSTIGPGEHAQGLVILDSKYRAGSVVLTQMLLDGGWEWSFK